MTEYRVTVPTIVTVQAETERAAKSLAAKYVQILLDTDDGSDMLPEPYDDVLHVWIRNESIDCRPSPD